MVSSLSLARTSIPASAMFGHSVNAPRPIGKRLYQAGKAGRHYANILGQHQGWMKYIAMIVASAILVASRVAIAWHSVVSAKDPHMQEYVKQEAIRTTAREAGGLTFSYILFKVIENKLNAFTEGMGDFKQNVREKSIDMLPKKGESTKQFFKNVWDALTKKEGLSSTLNPKKIYRKPAELNFEKVVLSPNKPGSFAYRYTNSKLFKGLVDVVVRMGRLSDIKLKDIKGKVVEILPSGKGLINNVKKAPTAQNMKALYQVFSKSFPLAVAGTVALTLSGFFLEWFTLNYMDEVAEKWAQMHAKPLQPTSQKLSFDTVSRANKVFSRYGHSNYRGV